MTQENSTCSSLAVHTSAPSLVSKDLPESQIDLVRDTSSHPTTGKCDESTRAQALGQVEGVSGVPQKSPKPHVLFPTSSPLRAHQRGGSNGESVESENLESTLKYTR